MAKNTAVFGIYRDRAQVEQAVDALLAEDFRAESVVGACVLPNSIGVPHAMLLARRPRAGKSQPTDDRSLPANRPSIRAFFSGGKTKGHLGLLLTKSRCLSICQALAPGALLSPIAGTNIAKACEQRAGRILLGCLMIWRRNDGAGPRMART